MIIFLKLLLAHFVGDFLFQPKSWVLHKEEKILRSWKLYVHILIHGILILTVFWDFSYWPIALAVFVTHGVIDILKLKFQNENKSRWFLFDQALHIISLLIIWILFFKPEINIEAFLKDRNTWIYANALLLITVVSSIVIRVLMSRWTKSIPVGESNSLNDAGKYIGVLERIFIFIFVVSGNWEGVGFLLAAKSIFRFGDLKEANDRKLTEYILIGTLMSFGIALGVGLLVVKLTG